MMIAMEYPAFHPIPHPSQNLKRVRRYPSQSDPHCDAPKTKDEGYVCRVSSCIYGQRGWESSVQVTVVSTVFVVESKKSTVLTRMHVRRFGEKSVALGIPMNKQSVEESERQGETCSATTRAKVIRTRSNCGGGWTRQDKA